MKTSKEQYAAVHNKFCELRKESDSYKYPAGAKPTIGNLRDMALHFTIQEGNIKDD